MSVPSDLYETPPNPLAQLLVDSLRDCRRRDTTTAIFRMIEAIHEIARHHTVIANKDALVIQILNTAQDA